MGTYATKKFKINLAFGLKKLTLQSGFGDFSSLCQS